MERLHGMVCHCCYQYCDDYFDYQMIEVCWLLDPSQVVVWSIDVVHEQQLCIWVNRSFRLRSSKCVLFSFAFVHNIRGADRHVGPTYKRGERAVWDCGPQQRLTNSH
jgi:hypothetical protein